MGGTMASEDSPRTDESPRPTEVEAGPSSAGKRRWWLSPIWAHLLGMLFFIGFLQFFIHNYLEATGVLGLGPSGGIRDIVAVWSDLVFWPSIGGLIGYVVSQRRFRGGLIGAAAGFLAADCLIL
jgi:hypothetical protein